MGTGYGLGLLRGCRLFAVRGRVRRLASGESAGAAGTGAGAQERAGGEVGEEQGEAGVGEEVGVLRAEAPGGTDGPEVLGKEQREHGEEHTRDFKPEDGRGVGEGVPEGAAEVAAAATDVAGLAADGLTLADAGLGGEALLCGGSRRRRGREDALCSEPGTDAERAAEGPWSHGPSVADAAWRRC